MSEWIANEIRRQIAASISVKTTLLEDRETVSAIESLAALCLGCVRSDGKIIFAGNGGSFADAQHLAAEFVSRLTFDRAPMNAVALGTNSSSLSAIGNDFGFSQVFSRELSAIAKPGDVFIPLSTSGNSENILTSIDTAKRAGLMVVGLTGQSGGKMKGICECIRMPSNETVRIQECHILVGHIICGLVEETYFRGKN